MPSIRKSLLQLTFSGAYLLRWNDKLRPAELVEIDKQAHKMLVACALWHENSRHLPAEERLALAQEPGQVVRNESGESKPLLTVARKGRLLACNL